MLTRASNRPILRGYYERLYKYEAKGAATKAGIMA